jgi:hypothetical protein
MDAPAITLYRASVGKRSWLILAAMVFILFAGAHGLFAGILATLAFPGVPYLLWCVLHPRTTHSRCNGRGQIQSRWFPWAHRQCRTCANGRVIRLGTRIIGPGYAKREHAAMVAARRTARAGNRWR